MVLPSTMLKKLKKLAMIYWSEHNHFCTIKYFMSITKDLQISALARALLYKVDPCEYQSSGIGMHLSDVATKGKYSYQIWWLIDSDCESWVKLCKTNITTLFLEGKLAQNVNRREKNIDRNNFEESYQLVKHFLDLTFLQKKLLLKESNSVLPESQIQEMFY